jgi:hypothetical protein
MTTAHRKGQWHHGIFAVAFEIRAGGQPSRRNGVYPCPIAEDGQVEADIWPQLQRATGMDFANELPFRSTHWKETA